MSDLHTCNLNIIIIGGLNWATPNADLFHIVFSNKHKKILIEAVKLLYIFNMTRVD